MVKKIYIKTKYPCIYKSEIDNTYLVDINKTINGKVIKTSRSGISSLSDAKNVYKHVDDIAKEIYLKKYKKETMLEKEKKENKQLEFDYYLDKYFNHVLLETENSNTVYKKRNKFNNYIVPFFKELRNDFGEPYDIREIDITVIEQFKCYLNERKKSNKEPLAVDTKNTVYAQLSAYFNYLKDCLEIIDKNPCTKVKNWKVPSKEITYYSLDQVNMLLKTIDDDDEKELKIKLLCKAIVKTLFFTGYRPSELFGLKFKYFDYDLINNNEINVDYIKIKINNTLVYSKGGWLESDGKTEHSLDNNYVGKNALSALFEYIRYIHNRYIIFEKDDYIFINPDTGKVYSIEYIRKLIDHYMNKAGLPHLMIKDFRHSTATLLLSNGYSMEEVKEKLRHTSIKTTEKHYATFYEECKINVAKDMDKLAT